LIIGKDTILPGSTWSVMWRGPRLEPVGDAV